MLVDPQPAYTVPASAEARDQWVDARLIGVLMEQALPALLSSLAGLLLLSIVLWNQVDTTALAVWLMLLTGVMLFRLRLILMYRKRYGQMDSRMKQLFIRRYGWTWTLMGLLVGAGAGVGLTFFVGSAPIQFAGGMLLLAMGLLSLASFSVYMPIFNRYNNGLLGATVVGLLLPVLLGWVPLATFRDVMALVLAFPIYWWLLQATAKRLNQVQRSSLELQYSNQELIDSLTQQTRTALRAVTTKNRFMASAAHDLRQPVHALSLYADWLATEPEMARDIAPRILQSTRAINELFDSLFDLTRIDSGNYKVRLQHVDVQQLFADMVLQFEPVAAAKSLSLRTHAKPTTVWADPVMLRRILGNLVSNALRHTHHGGVLLALRHRADMLVFEVWDTGVGIAREHQQAIFQEFFRVSQHQGTEDSLGLGLTIVSRLSTLMGYQLTLNSQPGRGSVFRVMLPAFIQRQAVRSSD